MSKLRFHVVSCTSEESDYPADELNSHGPNTRGWQSAKFSTYPQEIGIEIDSGESRFSQIQILSHQSKISSKVEIFIGTGSNYESATFKRLGHLSLDSNEKSNYQARELKTVYIDNLGKFVKILLHANHVNTYNTYNQISIIAVNLIGTPLESTPSLMDGIKRANPISNNSINDLALDMNLDPQTTAKLRQLYEAKTRAVAAEDYITAKKIKTVENSLKELGARLTQVEISKRKAVENEDYDRAKELKDECDSLREEIEIKIAGVNIPGVTDNRIPVQRPAAVTAPFAEPIRRRDSTAKKVIDIDEIPVGGSANETKEYSSPTLKQSKRSPAIPDPEIDDVYVDDFDGEDRPIQPKSNAGYDDPYPDNVEETTIKQSAFPRGQHPFEGIPNFLDLPTPEEFTGKSREMADQGISTLIGDYRARALMSKVWTLRAAAMNKTFMMLSQFQTDPGISSCYPALMHIVRIGLEDKMQQVFLDSLTLLEKVTDLCKATKLPRSTVGPVIDPIIAILIEKQSDTNFRIKDGAKKATELMMHSPIVGPSFISSHALKPLNSKQQANWKVLLARLKILSDLVSEFGLGSNVGLSTESVMNFCKNHNAFSHGNGEVRDATKELTKFVQKIVGTPALDSYLGELRQKQLDEYFAAFGEERPPEAATKQSQPSNSIAKKSESKSSSTATSPKASKSNPSATPSKGGSSSTAQQKSNPAAKPNAKDPEPINNPPNAAQNFTTCMFCGASDKTWNEDALDLHFWKSCPLLTPCPACAQVVEIAGLPEHLLDECEHKIDYVPCDSTGLAIKKDEFDSWQRSKNCKPPPDNCIYCPLCLSSVEDSDEAWKQHLMLGCPRNNRTRGS